MSNLPVHVGAFEPANLDGAMLLAERLRQSALVPKHLRSPADVLVVMMTGRELGLGTMQALRSVHVVEGKPTLSADLMAALCARSAVCEYFAVVEMTPTVATVETLRKGHPARLRFSYTIDQAKAAGLAGKDNWRKYPAQMLKARAVSIAARAVYPDLMVGVYGEGELPGDDRAPSDAETAGPSADIVDAEFVEDTGGEGIDPGEVTISEPSPSTSTAAGGPSTGGGSQTPPAAPSRPRCSWPDFDARVRDALGEELAGAWSDRFDGEDAVDALNRWRESEGKDAVDNATNVFHLGGALLKLEEGDGARWVAWMREELGR